MTDIPEDVLFKNHGASPETLQSWKDRGLIEAVPIVGPVRPMTNEEIIAAGRRPARLPSDLIAQLARDVEEAQATPENPES